MELNLQESNADNTLQSLLNRLYGLPAKDKIMTDLAIVAAATKKGLDVVYSVANAMLSKEAKTAYGIVNSIKGERTPNFRSYGGFKNDIS